MKLIVGLGNPGTKYAATRHNVGAWFVEALAKHQNATWHLSTKFHSRMAEIKENIYLSVPATYMNLSGQAVASIAHFYKILPEEILIAHDEIDLPLGTIRLKLDGGHGGHNGLRSIMECLHAKNFYRLRIGIGRPGRGADVSDYVLSPPAKSELPIIHQGLERVLEHMDLILNNEINKAMQVLHVN